MPWRLSSAQEATGLASMLWTRAVHESFGAVPVSLSLPRGKSSDGDFHRMNDTQPSDTSCPEGGESAMVQWMIVAMSPS